MEALEKAACIWCEEVESFGQQKRNMGFWQLNSWEEGLPETGKGYRRRMGAEQGSVKNKTKTN